MTIEELLRMLGRMERTGNMDALSDAKCIRHAIEAIKILQEIAWKGPGHPTRQYVALAQNWINSLNEVKQ